MSVDKDAIKTKGVFSQPARALTIDEIEHVSGGLEEANMITGPKEPGGPDNQGRHEKE